MQSLGGRLFAGQLLVIGVTFLALVITILLIAPGLFLYHLEMTGEDDAAVQMHAQEAFETAVGLALIAAAVVAIIAAVLLSWFLARRVSAPITELAAAAESVADGRYDVTLPDSGFGTELHTLSTSFQEMADALASTDAARSRLLSDLSHEIRTPLATLEAHIDGLEDGHVRPDAATFEVMRGQVHRLNRLASDVKLAAAAQEHALDLHPTSVDLKELVDSACTLFAPRYRDKGVALTNACTHGWTVVVDPDRMQQVLANLLDNALRHTPRGGEVRVSCSPGEICVQDTGEGIAAEDLERVFDRFQRLDAARTDRLGSGLGLTIARAIVAEHGGTLTAASDGPGKGSVFAIRLPA